MLKRLTVVCAAVAAGTAAVYGLDLADRGAAPESGFTPSKTRIEAMDPAAGPLEKAGRVADELIEKTGITSGDVEAVAEQAQKIGQQLGKTAAKSAGEAIEKVRQSATKAVVKAEELADKGKDAAIEAADNLGESIRKKTGGD